MNSHSVNSEILRNRYQNKSVAMTVFLFYRIIEAISQFVTSQSFVLIHYKIVTFARITNNSTIIEYDYSINKLMLSARKI